MFGSVRKTTKSWTGKAVIIVLALSFGVWGIGDAFIGHSGDVVAVVGDTEVTSTQFSRAFRREVQRLQQTYPQITSQEANEMGVSNQVLAILVRQALLDEEADALGLRTPDGRVVQALHDTAAFHDESGRFDRAAYERALSRNRITPEEYESLIRADLRRSQLLGTIGSPRPAPRALSDALYRYQEEARNAAYVLIAGTTMTQVPAPTEAELLAYHEANAALFTAPEYRALTLARLSIDAIRAELEVSEDDLRAAYDTRIGEFETPEQRSVQQILAVDQALINEGAEMLGAGKSFEEVSEALAARGATSFSLGAVERGDLDPAVTEVVFSLEAGAVSDPVASRFGWHLFKLDGITPARAQDFAEIREQLRSDLAEELAYDDLYRLHDAFEDARAGEAPLEMAARPLGIPIEVIDSMDAIGLDRAGDPVLAGVESRDEILALALDTEAGAESPLIELSDGSFVALRVDRIDAPAVKPLDDIRDEVRESLLRERRSEAAETQARAFADSIAGGTPLAEAAGEAGYPVARLEGVTRDGRNGEITSQDLVRALFSVEPSSREPVVARVGDGWAVAVLSGVSEASAGDAPNSWRDRVTERWSDEVAEAFGIGLHARYRPTVNPTVLNSLFETP